MWEPLCVDVQGKTIVVTMPGSDFAANYEKHPDQPDALCFHKRKARANEDRAQSVSLR